MKKIIVIFLLSTSSLFGQYFQQEVNYNIKAEIDSDDNRVKAKCQIDYHNNSPLGLDTIYFHLWANAFSSKSSPFARQLLKTQNLNFHFAGAEEMGGYEKISYMGKGSFELDSENPDMAFLVLEKPLLAGENRLIEFEFTLKIPKLFSRLGINESGDIHLVHWFPKPAVLDHKGWHWFPYLALGEFYSEFGTYNVSIEVDKNYAIGSTGIRLKGKDDKHYFMAENVFDFALFFVKEGHIIHRNFQSLSGKNLDLYILHKDNNPLWEQSAMPLLEKSIRFYEKEIGPYSYPQLTLVNGAKKTDSGMEYPMVIEVSAWSEDHLRYYINHEVGHQWFFSQLGFNEREEPFLDEGLTTFYEHKYTKSKINSEHHTAQLSPWPRNSLEMPLLQYIYVIQKRRNFSQSPSENPENTSLINYGLNAYERAAYVYSFQEEYLGKEVFQLSIKAFYHKWKGKHPSMEDLIDEFSNQSDKNISWFQSLLATDATIDFAITKENNEFIVHNNGNIGIPARIHSVDTSFWMGVIPAGTSRPLGFVSEQASINKDFLGLEEYAENNHTKSTKPTLVLGLNMDHSRKKEIYYLPAIRYNYADGPGLGLSLYNSSVVPKRMQYLIDPQYGIRSKKVVGNAWLAYNIFPENSFFRKIQSKISLKRYSDFYSDDLDVNTDYIRVAPQVSLHFKDHPASLAYRKLTFESIHLRKEELDFISRDEFLINGNWNHFFKARYDYFNFKAINRVEYWSELEFQRYENPMEESQHYLKWSGAFKYKTPYALGREINIRIFGSGFVANTQRESASYNNVFSMGSIALLSQSQNDYTRSQYFLTRQQGGSFTNQIGTDGGGFKDAFGSAFNIGMSNDFAIAANFSVDFPARLPFFFKLKPYFDVGYYRTKSTTEESLRGRTLMSGGMMLSYLAGGLEVYFPLYANDPIQNIYDIENEGIFKKISFKIDLHRLNPWDLIDDLNL